MRAGAFISLSTILINRKNPSTRFSAGTLLWKANPVGKIREPTVADNWFEAAFGSHYPLLYKHRDQDEAGRCLTQMDALVPLGDKRTSNLLDLGCGDGRHLELLQQRGYDPVGLDLSSDLLNFAGERQGWTSAPRLVRGDMRYLPFKPGSFHSILSLFTAFGYFGTPAENQGPAREIASALKSGGHWYLDYFDGDKVRAELGDGQPRVRRRELGPLMVAEKRWYEAGRSVVSKEVRLIPLRGRESEADALGIDGSGLSYTEEVAVFALEQLTRMASAEDLELVASAGGYEGQGLGEGTRWILVFRKMAKALKI
jgi:SAM-dependent methyltransferase